MPLHPPRRDKRDKSADRVRYFNLKPFERQTIMTFNRLIGSSNAKLEQKMRELGEGVWGAVSPPGKAYFWAFLWSAMNWSSPILVSGWLKSCSMTLKGKVATSEAMRAQLLTWSV